MRCYIIHDNQITVSAEAPKAIDADTVLIQSPRDLDARRFPTAHLVHLWNALPGTSPVKRFTSRSIAVKRLWAALESLPITSARTDSKQARLIALLQRPEGASLQDMTQSTGWQPHSVRGVLSGVISKKLGFKLNSAKEGEHRIYRILP
jgi:hypothetical protein